MNGNILPQIAQSALLLARKTIQLGTAMLLLVPLLLPAQTLRVALTDNDYPPYYFGQDDALKGFSVEVLSAVAKDIGVTLQWQRMPWRRVLQQVEAGHADVITVFYKTPQRLLQYGFSAQSYLTEPVVLLCAQPCQHGFDGQISSLGPVTIAIVRDFSYGERIDQTQFDKVAIIESDLKLVRLLANKRLDYGLASAYSARYAFELEQVGQRVGIMDPPLDYVEVYFGLSKKSGLPEELVARFNQALSQFMQTEHYRTLLSKYQLTVQQ